MGKYDDIINLPHHQSEHHPRMSLLDRAAQFAPFAALTGYDSEIRETARLTKDRMELDEDSKQRINEMLQYMLSEEGRDHNYQITYFVADEKKQGGDYKTVRGHVKKVDVYDKKIVMEDKSSICIENITDVEKA